VILRDYACPACGHRLVDVFAERDAVVLMRECPACGGERFVAVCNGGMKSRWRYADWPTWQQDPDFYKGQTSHSMSVVEYDDDGNEKTTTDLDGNPIEDRPRFKDPDVQGERRDRAEHEMRRESGKTTLYFDT